MIPSANVTSFWHWKSATPLRKGYTEEVRAAGLKAIQNYWGSVDFSEYTALVISTP